MLSEIYKSLNVYHDRLLMIFIKKKKKTLTIDKKDNMSDIFQKQACL